MELVAELGDGGGVGEVVMTVVPAMKASEPPYT